MITISIVSHGHGAMVQRLVEQLVDCPEVTHIIVTRNIPESMMLLSDSKVKVIENVVPKGFGANHNEAFTYCRETFFCVLNPDIELVGNPFTLLLTCLQESSASVVAPLILAPQGEIEDSMRHFPTPGSIVYKIFGGADGRYDVVQGQAPIFPEWVAGMFMLFRSEDFARVGGFDEDYFLYYEDVDICTRIWRQGGQVQGCPQVEVIHDARRASRRNWQHMRWHLASMMRYFIKHLGRLPVVKEAV